MRIPNYVFQFTIAIFLFFLLCPMVFHAQEESLLDQGKEAFRIGDYQLASSIFKSGLNTSSNKKELSNLYFNYALTHLIVSRIEFGKTIELLDSALSYKPSNHDAAYLRARINYYISGDRKIAYPDFQTVYLKTSITRKKYIIKVEISRYFIWNNVTEVSRRLTDTFQKTQSKKLQSEAQYALAVIKYNDGKTDEALSHLNLSLTLGYNEFNLFFLDFKDADKLVVFTELMEKYNIPSVKYSQLNPSLKRKIKLESIVETKINTWLKKEMFETTLEYQSRVTDENRTKQIEYFTQQIVDSLGNNKLRVNQVKYDYDADNEIFKIDFEGFEPIFVQVPIAEAPSFDEHFDLLVFKNISYTLDNEYEINLQHLVATNPLEDKYYIYDIENNVAFISNKLILNFDKIDISSNELNQSKTLAQVELLATRRIKVGKSDVDIDIPINQTINTNTYALIIGNEDYSKYQVGLESESNVDFARNDAKVFAEYVEKTLGVPKKNITVLLDGISSQMEREIERLSLLLKYAEGSASLIFYYAGHGFPDEQTKDGYLVPVDITGSDVKRGIKLSYLFKKLEEYPSEKVIILLDACFSGGGRNKGLIASRGIRIKPQKEILEGNTIVFSSSSNDQSSLPYYDKQHGMFTYFLLKKIKESKGKTTMKELGDYLLAKVQLNSVLVNNKEQNPYIQIGKTLSTTWHDITF